MKAKVAIFAVIQYSKLKLCTGGTAQHMQMKHRGKILFIFLYFNYVTYCIKPYNVGQNQQKTKRLNSATAQLFLGMIMIYD